MADQPGDLFHGDAAIRELSRDSSTARIPAEGSSAKISAGVQSASDVVIRPGAWGRCRHLRTALRAGVAGQETAPCVTPASVVAPNGTRWLVRIRACWFRELWSARACRTATALTGAVTESAASGDASQAGQADGQQAGEEQQGEPGRAPVPVHRTGQ